MATKTTHVFKTIGDLELKVTLYKTQHISSTITKTTPVALFLHGGGFVAFNREHVPAHVVQSCLIRGWPLVSADYRLMPQVKAGEIFEDVRDAYGWVREKLPDVMGGGEKAGWEFENVVLVGQSAGAYLAYAGGLHLTPPPIGILTYYGFASMNTPGNQKGASIKTSNSAAVTLPQVQKYLDEPVNTNTTPAFNMFHPECLLSDLSRNPDYKQPDVNLDNPADNRIIVMRWILQEDGYEPWFGPLETDLKDEKWEKAYPPTFMVHGDADTTVPVSDSRKLLYVLGPIPPRLFVANGAGHCFDQFLYLGDEALKPVEKAWGELEKAVQKKLGAT